MATFEFESVSLQCTQKRKKMTTNILNRRAQHCNVREEPVHYWRKVSSYWNVLSSVGYEGHSKVQQGIRVGQME